MYRHAGPRHWLEADDASSNEVMVVFAVSQDVNPRSDRADIATPIRSTGRIPVYESAKVAVL